eukprot:2926485-Pleurochrysis_carterae.AAC.2
MVHKLTLCEKLLLPQALQLSQLGANIGRHREQHSIEDMRHVVGWPLLQQLRDDLGGLPLPSSLRCSADVTASSRGSTTRAIFAARGCTVGRS